MAQNINLYSAGRRQRAPFSRVGALVVTAAVLLAGTALYALEAQRQAQMRNVAQETERALSRLEKQLTAAPNVAQKAQQDLNALEKEVIAIEATAARLNAGVLGRTSGFTAQLRALARGSTDGVWLTGIRFDNVGAQIALEGKALEAARVPALIERLSRAPQFSGTTFATIEMKPAEEVALRAPATLVRFRLATPVIDAEKKAAGGKS